MIDELLTDPLHIALSEELLRLAPKRRDELETRLARGRRYALLDARMAVEVAWLEKHELSASNRIRYILVLLRQFEHLDPGYTAYWAEGIGVPL